MNHRLTGKSYGSTITLIVLLFFSYCTPSNKNPGSIAECLVDSVYLPVDESRFAHSVNPFIHNGVSYAGYVTQNMQLFIYNLGKRQLVDSVLLPYSPNSVSKIVVSKDSALLLLENVNLLTLLHSKGKKTWDLTSNVREIDTFAYAANYGNPLFVQNGNKVILELYTNRTDTNGSYKKYAYWMIVQLNSDSVTTLSTYNPFLQHHFPLDYSDELTHVLTKNLDIIYSFTHCDTLFKKNFSTKAVEQVRLNSPYFKENYPSNPDSAFSYRYSNEYEINQSRFGTLLHDPVSKQLLRFMKHGYSTQEPNGDVNTYYDCPFSVFVVADDFTRQREYYIPRNLVTNFYMGFYLNNYLYIPADEEKQTVNGKTLYYKFRLGL